jgi:3-oxoacyl-[acyl-carrier protein] reductase
VTGSAGVGIGRGIAEHLLHLGASVVVSDRSARRVAEVEAELADEHPGRVLGVPMDVADPGAVRDAVQAVGDRCGTLDVLVNNAGHPGLADLGDHDPDRWRHVLAVNLAGVADVLAACLPILGDGAAVVNVASLAAWVPTASAQAAYVAAKAGVVALTRAAAIELAPRIRVNAVAPGFTVTAYTAGLLAEGRFDAPVDIVPLRRHGRPEDVAAVVAFLAGPDAAWITGETIAVAGGHGMRS